MKKKYILTMLYALIIAGIISIIGLYISKQSINKIKQDLDACETNNKYFTPRHKCFMNVIAEWGYEACKYIDYSTWFIYRHEQECIDYIARNRSDCEKIHDKLTFELCITWESHILQRTVQNKECDLLEKKSDIKKCKMLENWSITVQDLCKQVTDNEILKTCIKPSDSIDER